MSLNNLLKSPFPRKNIKKMQGGVDNNELTPSTKIIDTIVLFFLYFFILFFVAIGLDTISKNKTGVSQEQFTYAFVTILIIISILIFVYVSRTSDSSFSVRSIPIRLIFLIFIIFIIITIINFFNIGNYILIGLIILIVIVGLAIILNISYNVFEKSIQNNSVRFVIEFIFFIPCLLNDILKWTLDQIKMTNYLIYLLLIIEVFLILTYFYLPSIINKTFVKGGKVIQDIPFYINKGKEKTISTSADLKIILDSNNKSDLLSEINSINYTNPYFKDYAFSMWINMNPQNISPDTEIVIFSYGYPSNGTKIKECYKPKITYSYSSKNKELSVKDVYRIYFTGDNNEKNMNFYEIHVPNQRWNHFVINYVNGTMVELWINGIMKYVFKFDKNKILPNYDPTDQVVIGNKRATGTNGAICSVVYFDKSIHSHQIVNMYNLGINTQPYPGIQK